MFKKFILLKITLLSVTILISFISLFGTQINNTNISESYNNSNFSYTNFSSNDIKFKNVSGTKATIEIDLDKIYNSDSNLTTINLDDGNIVTDITSAGIFNGLYYEFKLDNLVPVSNYKVEIKYYNDDSSNIMVVDNSFNTTNYIAATKSNLILDKNLSSYDINTDKVNIDDNPGNFYQQGKLVFNIVEELDTDWDSYIFRINDSSDDSIVTIDNYIIDANNNIIVNFGSLEYSKQYYLSIEVINNPVDNFTSFLNIFDFTVEDFISAKDSDIKFDFQGSTIGSTTSTLLLNSNFENNNSVITKIEYKDVGDDWTTATSHNITEQTSNNLYINLDLLTPNTKYLFRVSYIIDSLQNEKYVENSNFNFTTAENRWSNKSDYSIDASIDNDNIIIRINEINKTNSKLTKISLNSTEFLVNLNNYNNFGYYDYLIPLENLNIKSDINEIDLIYTVGSDISTTETSTYSLYLNSFFDKLDIDDFIIEIIDNGIEIELIINILDNNTDSIINNIVFNKEKYLFSELDSFSPDKYSLKIPYENLNTSVEYFELLINLTSDFNGNLELIKPQNMPSVYNPTYAGKSLSAWEVIGLLSGSAAGILILGLSLAIVIEKNKKQIFLK